MGVNCKQFAKCPGVAKISKSYDVGGGYGKSSELLMMKEIIKPKLKANLPLDTIIKKVIVLLLQNLEHKEAY